MKTLLIIFTTLIITEAAWATSLKVATTNTFLEDFVREIGGDQASVRSLVPATVSPSKYQLKPADIRIVSGYDLFLYGTWETWAKKIISAVGGGKVRVQSIDIERGGIWGDPARAMDIAKQVAKVLIEMRPAQRAKFTAGLDRLEKTIQQAHQAARERLSLYLGVKVLICQDGLKYLLRSFGLHIVAQLVEKEQESGLAAAVSPGRVAEIIEQAKQRGARLIIYAPQLGLERTCGTIQKEVGIPKVEVPLSPGSVAGAETYSRMIQEAANRIAKALEAR
jgi:ABC-type Zn uptake system ZnuABC Zn-binding protein ZnuA